MIYLVLSDIHGNLPALEILLKKEKGNFDAIINLGDVVNYAPWSNECVQLIATLPHCTNLMGNHEQIFLEGSYSNPGKVSEVFFKVNFPLFTEFETIKNYKEAITLNNIIFTHTIQHQYIFKDTMLSVKAPYCVGHSHQQYQNNLNEFTIVNPGSVGQNRTFINVISYAFFDDTNSSFHFKEIQYDIQPIINAMEAKNFPAACIKYYKDKKIVT